MNDYVIQTRGLTRYFGNKCAVYELDLRVPRGSVFAFLGRNGSGKTTTIRMLLGLLDATRGEARILGQDSRRLSPQVMARIGYIAESHPVYRWMRVSEAAAFASRFGGPWNHKVFDAVISHFRVDARTRASELSRGERAGLSLALALAPEPELLILDDPALGLDPVARRSLLESMLYVTRGQGRTVFFSSHMLADVERVADCVAILDYSVLRAQCPMETFRQRVRQYVLKYPGMPPELPRIPGLLQAFRADRETRLTIANVDEATQQVLATLGAQSVQESPLSLEDALIAYMGERGEKSFFQDSLMRNLERQGV